MLNDFKLLNFSTTKKKIFKLLDIFQRLRLPDLEDRLLKISPRLEKLNQKLQTYTENLPTVIPGVPPVIPPVVPPSNLPDLAITGLKPTVYSNYINFEITITNVGTEDSPATTLNQIIPELLDNNVYVPALEPEEIFITNIQYSFDPAGDEESKTFLADVNPARSFPEITYENNSNSVMGTIKEPLTPPPGKGYLIVHVHNPEGKEINSFFSGAACIYSLESNWPGIYSFYPLATNISNHGIPILINTLGNYIIRVIFNGMIFDEYITIADGQTIELIFTIPRIENDMSFMQMQNSFNFSGSFNDTSTIEDETISHPDPILLINSIAGVFPVTGYYYTTTYAPPVWEDIAHIEGNYEVIYSYDVNKNSVQISRSAIAFINVLKGYGSFHLGINIDTDFHYSPIGPLPLDYPESRTKTINIPPQTEFTFWCVQQHLPIIGQDNQFGLDSNLIEKTTRESFRICRGSSDLIYPYPLERYYNYFLPANLGYDKYIMRISWFSLGNALLSGTIPRGQSWEHSILPPDMSTSGNILKMSSVPYDILGTAV